MFHKMHARLALTLLLAFSANSFAAFHLWKITEVYSNASGTVQFIELTAQAGGQQSLLSHTITSTQGTTINSFTFPANLPGDTTGKKFLIGTTGYAALSGVPAPNYIVPNGFVFTSNVTLNFAEGSSVITIPSLPTDGTNSINDTFNTATNSPTNFAGASGAVGWTFRGAPPPLIRNITVTYFPVTGTHTLIVSTLTDGMYKGTDTSTGTTWQKISNGIPIVQMRGHTMVSTTDFYAATEGAGVYKTSDSGTNWTAINGSGATALGCLDVRNVAVPVTTVPRTLLVSTSCRNGSGVYRSIDDGATWTRLGPVAGSPGSLPADVQSYALARIGTGPTTLYFLATANYGIFKSIDDGATWATANTGISGTNVFNTSFSGAAGSTAELLAYVHGSGVYRSADTGATWTPSNTGLPANFAALGGIDRETGQTLYIGLDKQGVYKTIDGGASWSAWGATANDEDAKFTRRIVASPSGPGRYYLGTLSGISKTSDNGLTLRNGNMPDAGRINAITHDRDAPHVAYITVHVPFRINNIWGDFNSDAVFTLLENGITGSTNEGAVYQDRLTPAILYVATNNRGIFKSTNAGGSFTAINNGLPSMIGQINRLAIDPTNSQTLYLGLNNAAGIYKSTDGGASWLSSSVGLSSPLALSVNQITIDGTNAANVWAATNAGLFKSTNSGANWALMYSAADGAGSALPVGVVRVRPGNSNEIYIANNHVNANGTLTASSGIHKSIDGGVTWSNILPNQPASQVRVTVGGDIYAGVSAQVGNPAVYLSTNGGTSFAPFSTNLRGSDIRSFGFASDDTSLISLSLENGLYTNHLTQPAAGLLAVSSRKIHGTTGIFDLAINTVPAISGAVTVEPRAIGTGHTIVFQFSVPVTSVGSVSSVDAAGPVGSVASTITGNDVVVRLTDVPDNRRATVSVSNVNGAGFGGSASVGFLVGDINVTRSTNSSDISSAKTRLGQITNLGNFLFDVNASGSITPADISAVKVRSGLVLP